MIDLPIKRGINLHTEDYALQDYLATEKYFKIIKEAGLDHVRLPVRGKHLEERGNEYLDHVENVCNTALRCGLIPIMDLHWYYDMCKEPEKYKDGFLALWDKLAAYWVNMDKRVIFEICNEPHTNYTFKLLNIIQNEVIKIIRKHQPDRLLLAACAHYNTIENLHFLELPEDDENIIVTIHDYTPMALTHQGMGNRPRTDYQWDTPEMREYLAARFNVAAVWAKMHNRRLHIGEFGVPYWVDIKQRESWISYMIELFEEHRIAYSYWEMTKGFRAWKNDDEEWYPEIIKALAHK